MLIESGRVAYRGAPLADAQAGETLDLGGKTLMPKFVDAHCHILPTGLDLMKLNLGHCSNHAAVLDSIRDQRLRTPEPPNPPPPEPPNHRTPEPPIPRTSELAWLLAVHYDQTKYPEGHLHRDQLDAVSHDRPILLKHSSGHASLANTAALRAAGVDESTPDPVGGEYVRDASGRLTGVLLEKAHEHVHEAEPRPSPAQMVEAILLAGERMAALGIGTAADMSTGGWGLEAELLAYREAAERGCRVRLRLYALWSQLFGPRAIDPGRLRELTQNPTPDAPRQAPDFRVCGIKIFSDGAVGAGTAAIYGSYASENPPPQIARSGEGGKGGEVRETSGRLIYPPERLTHMVKTAAEAGYQVAVHSIGDYATDLVLNAFEETPYPSRHRIEHAMLLSDAQIERLASLNPHVTMQPEFLVRFAHAYRRQLGPERAAAIKRFRSVKDAGLRLSLNSDRPIVSGDPWLGIATASNRPEGFDPAESLARDEAILAYTAFGAEALEDESEYGSLEVGQLADWQVVETVGK